MPLIFHMTQDKCSDNILYHFLKSSLLALLKLLLMEAVILSSHICGSTGLTAKVMFYVLKSVSPEWFFSNFGRYGVMLERLLCICIR